MKAWNRMIWALALSACGDTMPRDAATERELRLSGKDAATPVSLPAFSCAGKRRDHVTPVRVEYLPEALGSFLAAESPKPLQRSDLRVRARAQKISASEREIRIAGFPETATMLAPDGSPALKPALFLVVQRQNGKAALYWSPDLEGADLGVATLITSHLDFSCALPTLAGAEGLR